MAFILLCIAVLLVAAPLSQPYVNWFAFALALVALILAAVGYRGGHMVISQQRPHTSAITMIASSGSTMSIDSASTNNATAIAVFRLMRPGC